ncbi:MAG TPA: M48 family metalloprotease [Hydrogenophaga sp.]|uniref:M48 family metalloprotease n=1 Tax=Hydrogenophaga sp. TaxID=1904254 RepID=UPI002B5D4ABE|nr:M48 family metalloprotease [Hydrogenophaga sp.]HMN93633.1 M48 family metalloprotease [Hydrogenophaga sp.]HMP09526.1 M48 family metalloprotease [Hydrogenophaga sp.]
MRNTECSPAALAQGIQSRRLSRRQALWLVSASSGAAALASLQGCAQSPVTGQTIVVGMSEAQERAIDAQVAPHQFSQDLGAIQDPAVNRYVADVGQSLHRVSHRPDMPYSYRVLNANYVNAYTFPGGAMGVTRGILSELNDEAELAALLGHEIAHVNARHAAQRQGQAMVAQAAVLGLNVAAQGSRWGELVGLGSQIGASALLASYSRDNEREADALGQDYMVRGGYPAQGMTRLHQLLVDQEKSSPGLLATMFSSHPMSGERRDTAARLASTRHAGASQASPRRERFMDETASLRRIRPTITACKNGEVAMAAKAYDKAQPEFRAALRHTPQDYAAHVRMAQCLQAMGRTQEARTYARQAQSIYPQEAQAHKLSGVLALSLRNPAEAFEGLDRFDRQLPGDPGVVFLKGVALEGMNRRPEAAVQYRQFLQITQQGQAAQYASSRLREWGMIR